MPPLFLERSVTANCVLTLASYYKNDARKDLEIHFYDEKFALYRHKVSNPTIKRFLYIVIMLPFCR